MAVHHLILGEAGVMGNKQRDPRRPVRQKLDELFALRGRAAVVQQELQENNIRR